MQQLCLQQLLDLQVRVASQTCAVTSAVHRVFPACQCVT